jgi:hypothetical protein
MSSALSAFHQHASAVIPRNISSGCSVVDLAQNDLI